MNGFSLNGVHCSSLGIIMRSKNRTVLPMVNDVYVQISGRDGSLLFDRELADRTIVIDCTLVKHTLSDLRVALRQIAAWLNTNQRVQLIFDDEPDKYYLAKYDGAIELEQAIAVGEFSISFRCEPYAYSLTQKTADFVSDATTIVNDGTVKCFPVFTAVFTTSTTELKIIKDTEYVHVVKNFATNDVLVIDCAKGTVKLNGTSIMTSLDWQNSIFFDLTPGSNSLTVTPTGKASVSVTFCERWL